MLVVVASALAATVCLWLLITLLMTLSRDAAAERKGIRIPPDFYKDGLLQGPISRILSTGGRLTTLLAAASGTGVFVFVALFAIQAHHLTTAGERSDELRQLARIASANERMAASLERADSGTTPVPLAPSGPVQVVSEDLTRIADALDNKLFGVEPTVEGVPIPASARWVLGVIGAALAVGGLLSLTGILTGRIQGRVGVRTAASLAFTGLGALSLFGALIGEVKLSPFSGLTLFQKVEVRHVTYGGGPHVGTSEPGNLECNSLHRFGDFISGQSHRVERQEREISLADTTNADQLTAWLQQVRPARVLVIGSTDSREFRRADSPRGNADLAERRANAVGDLIMAMPADARPDLTMMNGPLGVARLVIRTEGATADVESGREVILCALGPRPVNRPG